MKNLCKESGCTNYCKGHGFCSLHYQRWWKHGDSKEPSPPMLGKKHSLETKAKMRASALGRKMSPEARKKMSEVRKGRIISSEQRQKISLSLKGRAKTPEHIAKVAAAQVGKKRVITEGMKQHHLLLSRLYKGRARPPQVVAKILGRLWHGGRPEYSGVKFRSSYEVRLAKAFDKRRMRWVYEPERFDLGSCSYTPDFYLPDLDSYWETKGFFAPESQIKVRLFREKHPDKPLIVANLAVIKMMEAGLA